MMAAVAALFPQPLSQLLRGVVYPVNKIEELMEGNALDEVRGADRAQNLPPIFHRSRAKGQSDDGSDGDSDDDYLDDDANERTLRKCSAASLDTLVGVGGAPTVLPPLLLALQEGIGHPGQWVALGAIADGRRDNLVPHLPRLHPFLLQQLNEPESLPQL